MTVNEISTLIRATLLTGEDHLDTQINYAFGSDMMSDALAYADSHTILLTGLCNLQVLRTAEMLDIPVVLFVRGKQPDEAMMDLAKENNICLLTTQMTMFNSCGILYEAGLRGGQRHG